MSEDRFDFSKLDLGQDDERFERMVGNIMWRARGELARRKRGEASALEVVAAWFRPAFAAAAAIAGISLTLLATAQKTSAEYPTGAYMSAAEVPAALSSWYEDDQAPTAAELLVASE